MKTEILANRFMIKYAEELSSLFEDDLSPGSAMSLWHDKTKPSSGINERLTSPEKTDLLNKIKDTQFYLSDIFKILGFISPFKDRKSQEQYLSQIENTLKIVVSQFAHIKRKL